jgi:hypothetical protein
MVDDNLLGLYKKLVDVFAGTILFAELLLFIFTGDNFILLLDILFYFIIDFCIFYS